MEPRCEVSHLRKRSVHQEAKFYLCNCIIRVRAFRRLKFSTRFPRAGGFPSRRGAWCCVESCRGTVIPATKIVQVDLRKIIIQKVNATHIKCPYVPQILKLFSERSRNSNFGLTPWHLDPIVMR